MFPATQSVKSLFIFSASLIAAACGSQDRDKKLDDIVARLERIEKKVETGGRIARPPMPSPEQADPKTVYSVPVDGSPAKGPSNAKVTIVEAYDFACPYCRRVDNTLDELEKQYGKDLRIVSKQYVVHPQTATIPALAACAAQKQDKFSQMEKQIWEKGWPNQRPDGLGREMMESIAKDLKLDLKRFKADLDSEACKKKIEEDRAEMARLGVRGTPAFFINGRSLSGAQPLDAFKAVIDEELKKANEAIRSGAKLEEYYNSIVAKGKKSAS